MLIPAPSTSLTQPSGWAKALVRGEGDGRPGAVSPLQGSVPGVRSPGVQWPTGLLLGGFCVPSFLPCRRELYWARRVANN